MYARSDTVSYTHLILSSVVPELTGLVEAAVGRLTKAAVLRVGPGVRTGFRIRIDDPSQLGGDLVADTLAALTEYGAPLIILDAGTVTTLAVVDESRTYLGGCILPGIRASASLLKSTTALLPSITLGVGEKDCLGRNSADAMRCGMLLGLSLIHIFPERKWPYVRSIQTVASLCQMAPCSTLEELGRACSRLMRM